MMQMEERKALPHGMSASSDTQHHHASAPNTVLAGSQMTPNVENNPIDGAASTSQEHGKQINPSSKGDIAYYQSGNMQGYPPQQNGIIGTRRQATCPVCMSHTIPSNVVLEPCQHQFHYQCIDVYTQNAKICPVCRVPIQRHMPLGRPTSSSMQQQQQQHQQPEYPSQPPSGYPMSSANQQQPLPHMMHNNSNAAMQTSQGGGPSSSAVGHFASASVYELPPEVFLDNSYEQSGTSSIQASKMRKGKWTSEEAAYCDRLIEEFKHGNLPLAEGTTLRTFLSKLLNCDPMRISKKYTGNQCIGKIIFRRKSKEPTKDEIEMTRKQLAELERIYLDRERMNQQRREKRLESEVNRDRSRLLSARNLVYAPPPPQQQTTASAAMLHHHHHPNYPNYHHPPPTTYQQHSSFQQPPPGYAAAHPSLEPPPGGASAAKPPTAPPAAPTSSKDVENSHSNIKTEVVASTPHNGTMKREHSLAMMHDKDALPRISSVDSFSSMFPRIASLDCFQSLSSHRPPPHHPPPSQHHHSLYRSPSLECLNTIPRVGSLEQFSNFIANMPPEPTSKAAVLSGTTGTTTSNTTTTSSSPPKPAKPPTAAAFPRIASLDRLHLPRAPSMDRLPRINSTDGFLPHVPSFGSFSAFGSFSNLGVLTTKDKAGTTSSTTGHSSIEDILSLVAASGDGPADKKRKAASTSYASLADHDLHVDKKPSYHRM